MNKVEMVCTRSMIAKAAGLISERKMYGGVPVHFNERLHMLQSGFRFNKVQRMIVSPRKSSFSKLERSQ